jgi:hypothetical protein
MDLGTVMKVKKLIEYRDIVSIEEGDEVAKRDVDMEVLSCITTTYGELYVNNSYKNLKSKWLKYKEELKKSEGTKYIQ